MQQLVEFGSIEVDDEQVDEVLQDLHTVAQLSQNRVGLYIGRYAVVVKPEETAESVCKRFHQSRERQERWIHDRRRSSNNYDGIERRRTA